MDKIRTIILMVLVAVVIIGCGVTVEKPVDESNKGNNNSNNIADGSTYERYRGSFFDTFDTVVYVVGYAESDEKFQSYMNNIEQSFIRLHKLYDIYNNYEGINNVKTINDKAGIEPVKVDKDIIELIKFSKQWYDKTYGKTNIALGPVTKIWHDYRDRGSYDPINAQLPPMELLQEANKYTDINKVIVDEVNSTVFLEDKNMRLDVGAVAKGYATELVAQEMKAMGFNSAMISAGGNVRVLDKPMDSTINYWGTGIQDPDKIAILADENLLDTIFINDTSVVSSGDYQRYYVVDGKIMHHIIDPDTLMPPDYYRAVTIVTQDSGLADYLSTVLFALPYEDSKALAQKLGNVEVLWIFPDGTIKTTDGMNKIMKSKGATK